jgi:hypothetical protein
MLVAVLVVMFTGAAAGVHIADLLLLPGSAISSSMYLFKNVSFPVH